MNSPGIEPKDYSKSSWERERFPPYRMTVDTGSLQSAAPILVTGR